MMNLKQRINKYIDKKKEECMTLIGKKKIVYQVYTDILDKFATMPSETIHHLEYTYDNPEKIIKKIKKEFAPKGDFNDCIKLTETHTVELYYHITSELGEGKNLLGRPIEKIKITYRDSNK